MMLFRRAQGDKKAGPGRAFLLPLLATHITNTRLTHFTTVFVPLSEQLFDMKVKADEAEKVNESKVWEVLIAQIWACFKGYCDLAVDTKEVCSSVDLRSNTTNRNHIFHRHSQHLLQDSLQTSSTHNQLYGRQYFRACVPYSQQILPLLRRPPLPSRFPSLSVSRKNRRRRT